jgi:hypothetical protein
VDAIHEPVIDLHILRLGPLLLIADEPDAKRDKILVANPLLPAVVPPNQDSCRWIVVADAKYRPVTHGPLERDLDDARAAHWAKFLIDRAHQ